MKSGDYFDYCNRILLSIQKSPKSVKEISIETKIQVSVVYKMIRLLKKNDLVLITGILHRHGKRRLFQCNGSLKSAQLVLCRIFQMEFV